MSFKNAVYDAINSRKLGRAFLRARRDIRGDEAVRAIQSGTHDFIDRSKGYEKLCIILAGYKPTLWEDVFGRLAAFIPDDIDVCIMT